MENLVEKTKFETLKSSMQEGASFVFPPHRRVHLKSETYRTLVRILSVIVDEPQCSPAPEAIPEDEKPGIGEDESRNRNQHEMYDELVEPDGIGPENSSIENTSVTDKSTAVIANRPADSTPERMITDEFENRMGIGGNGELVGKSSIQKDFIANDVASINNKYDRIRTNGPGQAENDRRFNLEISEAMNVSSSYKDLAMKEFEPIDGTKDETLSFEQKFVEEVDHGGQKKDLGLNKSFSSDCVLDSSDSLIADGEIEDGEITDELGISGDSCMEEKHQGMCNALEEADNKDKASTSYLVNAVGYNDTRNQKELTESSERGVKEKADMLSHDNAGNIKVTYEDDHMIDAGQEDKKDDRTKGATDGLGLHGEILKEIGTEDTGIVSTVKDVEVHRKRKRGPKTQEGKAKKKMKERKRRAKKNKLLGVKRLKLHPIIKPKTVKYCDYYLKGRCQKGDLCKFSHDTIPLTKSQPCVHFARHSCMKGDDCPFDHELSKYPCNKYVSTGFCSRGDNCLFSHKVPVNKDSLESGECKGELESSSMMDNTDSVKQLNLTNRSQPTVNNLSKDTTKVLSTVTSLKKKPEQNIAEMRVKPPAQVPKGISFLSFGKAPVDNTSEQKQDEVSSGGKETEIAIRNGKLRNSNEMPWKMPAALPPRGISFLSNGKPPLNNSSKQKQGDILSAKNDDIEICNRKSPSAADKNERSNEMPLRTPKNPISLSQSSNPLTDRHDENTPSSVQKALSSSLSFAAKFESQSNGKDSSIYSPSLCAGSDKSSSSNASANVSSSSCNSGALKSEPMRAAKMLEDFLFGFGRNNKQQ